MNFHHYQNWINQNSIFIQKIMNNYKKEIIAILCFSCFFLLPTKSGFINSCTALLSLAGLVIFITHSKQTKHHQSYWNYAKASHFIGLFLLLWLPIIFSTFNANNPSTAIKSSFAVLRYLFIFFALITIVKNNRIYHQLKTAIILVIIFWCFDGLLQWLLGYDILGYPYDRGGQIGTSRLSGIFAPKFHLGYVLATLSPLIFEWCYQYLWKKHKQHSIALIISGIFILVIFLSGSRAAWLSIIVSIILFLSYHALHHNIQLKKITILMAIFLITSLAILSLPSMQERVSLTFKPSQSALSNTTTHVQKANTLTLRQTLNIASSYRLTLWEASYKFFKQQPVLGIGANNFKSEYAKLPISERRELEEGFHPHLHILEIATEMGTIGLIAYLIMYISLIRITFKSKFGYEWLFCTLLAIFPLNMHVSIYSSFWQGLIFIPLALGLSLNLYQEQSKNNLKN